MHRNSCNIIDGWDTDAYLFAFTRPKEADKNNPDSVTRYFVASGSYLRKNGKVALDSLSKVYTVFVSGRNMQVHLEGKPMTNVRFRAIAKPESLVLNGRKVKVIYDQTARCVRVATRSVE
jgi:hypothetical protein